MRRARSRRGFTLIELLLVMIILAVLAALVVPKFTGRSEEARIQAADSQINSLFQTALEMYNTENGHYPTTAQGLDALRVKPTQPPEPKKWKTPYLAREIPADPWGNPYKYVCPGQNNPDGFDLSSNGPDGTEGTEDDVTNWKKSS